MKTEISVPSTALAIPGEAEGQSTPPAMGDSVDFSGTGKVTRSEGDKTYLEIETINGQPIEATEEKSMDDEEAEMRKEAQMSDGPSVY